MGKIEDDAVGEEKRNSLTAPKAKASVVTTFLRGYSQRNRATGRCVVAVRRYRQRQESNINTA